jgi:N-acetylmuramoyl-L-alanine amidase
MPSSTRPLFIRMVGALFALTLALAALLVAPPASAAGGCFNNTGPKGTVALDPGHGADDPGARVITSQGELLEKNLNLDIAGRTRDILTARGYRVCLTRTDDTTNPTNTQRAQYANSVGAKVFVLIHLNGSSDPTVNYTETFWGKKNKDLAFSQWMYNRLYPALDDVNWDGTRDYQVGGHGVGQFATAALLKSVMPGTLTESVFLTNSAEAERLTNISSTGRRQQIASVLADGIDSWSNTH